MASGARLDQRSSGLARAISAVSVRLGLSYTTFRYSNLRVTPDTIGAEGQTKVSVDVTNTGAQRGDDVAQLYIHEKVSLVTRAVKELRGFHRLSLDASEAKQLNSRWGPGSFRI